VLYTLDYFDLVGGRYIRPIQTKEYLGRAWKGLSRKGFRVKVISYFTDFFPKPGMKEKALKELCHQAVHEYDLLGNFEDQYPPLVIILANNSEDYIFLHQWLNKLESELGRRFWNSHNSLESDKIVVLMRYELLSDPKI
jgi:hypothetical protein